MRYISPDNDRIGFAAGEDVEFEWEIYEDASRRRAYTMAAGDRLELVILKPGAHHEGAPLLRARGTPGESKIVIAGEDTAMLEAGQYTAVTFLTRADATRTQIWPPIGAGSGGVWPERNCLITRSAFAYVI